MLKKLGYSSLTPSSTGHPSHYSRFLRALPKSAKMTLACDHSELIHSVALAGTMFAVLPTRLANRHPGELREVKIRDDLGKFKISMLSQNVCDPEEDAFLLSELRSLI